MRRDIEACRLYLHRSADTTSRPRLFYAAWPTVRAPARSRSPQSHPTKAPKRKLELLTSQKCAQRTASGKNGLGMSRGATPLMIVNIIPTASAPFAPASLTIRTSSRQRATNNGPRTNNCSITIVRVAGTVWLA